MEHIAAGAEGFAKPKTLKQEEIIANGGLFSVKIITLVRIPKYLVGAVVAVILVFSMAQVASADAIPYPTSGTPNPVTYTFTAASTGDVVAYFAGSTAAFDNELGLLVNGVSTGVIGLDNHTSALGTSLDFGAVSAGDTLVFVLHNHTLGMDAFSDPSLNSSYDVDGSKGHNHVYSTPYTATSPIIDSIPVGTFVSFEDLPLPGADFNYNDEDFVFTNVVMSSSVPEPSSLLLLCAGLFGLGVSAKRKFFS
jgi:hypothetical protein